MDINNGFDISKDQKFTDLEAQKKAYEKERDHVNAREVCREICDYLSDTLGPDHPDTLDYRVKLAFSYQRCREREEARRMMDEIHKRKCELFGELSPAAVRTFCAKAQLYNVEDDEDVFFDIEAEAHRQIGCILESDDIDVMYALYNYAYVMNEYYGHSALSVYEEIRDWTLKHRGAESHEYLSAVSELCDVYYELEFYDEAIEVGEEYYAHLLKKHGSDDEYVLMACENLAKVYFFNGDYSEAQRYLDTYVAVCERREGSEEKLLEAYYNMSLCAYLNKDTEAAKSCSEKMYELINTSINEENPLRNEALPLYQKIQSEKKSPFFFLRWHDVWGKLL